MTSLARRERTALCDLVLALGADAPTLCGDWNAQQLVAHLLVRERSPIGAAGILIKPLAGLTDREMARLDRQDLEQLVARLRTPRLTPVAIGPIDSVTNTLEFFVHHEDVRRAQPAWRRRSLSESDQDTLWRFLKLAGRGLVRSCGVPVGVKRSDADQHATLRSGDDPAIIKGLPSELVMFCYGRAEHRGLAFSGPADRVARLKAARLGV